LLIYHGLIWKPFWMQRKERNLNNDFGLSKCFQKCTKSLISEVRLRVKQQWFNLIAKCWFEKWTLKGTGVVLWKYNSTWFDPFLSCKR